LSFNLMELLVALDVKQTKPLQTAGRHGPVLTQAAAAFRQIEDVAANERALVVVLWMRCIGVQREHIVEPVRKRLAAKRPRRVPAPKRSACRSPTAKPMNSASANVA
jgi:hypothetical protein